VKALSLFGPGRSYGYPSRSTRHRETAAGGQVPVTGVVSTEGCGVDAAEAGAAGAVDGAEAGAAGAVDGAEAGAAGAVDGASADSVEDIAKVGN